MADKELDLTAAKIEAADVLTFATAVTIDNPGTWRRARELRAGMKQLEKKIDAYYKPKKQEIDEKKKPILQEEHTYTDTLEQIFANLDAKILDYEEEFFRDREALRIELKDKARKAAEDDRIAQAAELEKDGEHEAARQLLAQPLYVPEIVLPEYSDWVEGESRTERWVVDEPSIDIFQLMQAILDGKHPASLVVPNLKALNTMAAALKETFNVPGVKARRRRGFKQT